MGVRLVAPVRVPVPDFVHKSEAVFCALAVETVNEFPWQMVAFWPASTRGVF